MSAGMACHMHHHLSFVVWYLLTEQHMLMPSYRAASQLQVSGSPTKAALVCKTLDLPTDAVNVAFTRNVVHLKSIPLLIG